MEASDELMGVDVNKEAKMNGVVVLVKKSVLLDVNDFQAALSDGVHELVGKRVSFQLISAVNADPENAMRGRLSQAVYLEKWIKTGTSAVVVGESVFKLTFEWDADVGVPGAFIIKNFHNSEFYLKSLTLNEVPGTGKIHFVCDSWIYPAHRYKYNRIFFANQSYLPCHTPEPLCKYREEELVNLRGNGSGELKEWDRVYDYALYNDLGDPDKGTDHARPVLGGSTKFPYPRRGRTSRPPTKKDPESESRLPLLSLDIYVPSDERLSHRKMSDILAYLLKSIVQVLDPELKALGDKTLNEFDTFQDVLNIYEGGLQLPSGLLDKIKDIVPYEILKELLHLDGEKLYGYPMPQVINENKFAWRTDEEFGREMLAGVNPVSISLLKEFPPCSKLDPKAYGNQRSSITKEDIEKNLNGLTVNEALRKNKIFILDHHDTLMPYLNRINSTKTKTYASRTLLLLKSDGTLTPLAIELSLSHPKGEGYGAINKVFTPAAHGVEGSVWQLAKAYAIVNDSGVHQLISHWLNTHLVIEPFVIATNRQLSVLHPIHKLLHPHFRDTMNINAISRLVLINAGGTLENTVFLTKFSMEFTSVIYKEWVFTEQALPEDLIKRGIAVPDSSQPHGLHLLIEDYPYAVDGLEIWSAIKTWVHEYCSFYYPKDDLIRGDVELQSWWAELRDVGHGDKKDEPWWPKMQTLVELTETCTTIIWIASALHAAVNFGQYPYGGYLPNRPTISRSFMPERGTPEYAELESNPDGAFLKTITSQFQSLLNISIIEILSKHSPDELYLGQRDTPDWTSDTVILAAFARFGEKLVKIENRIEEMNNNKLLKNRVGPVNVPYTLLYPNTSNHTHVGGLTGLTARGVPNSTGI
ncbi:hypothetical protein GIB67_029054 [Kingdonia uniflora]|uniref:Lipoxygenase n=1 Tax=Kingdonia uniflora TaxID=39325 RepID=A0A7J7N6L3_9MAGN|nr:hypothetical protein GIB67_029054 [Kingdonia uniflora]